MDRDSLRLLLAQGLSLEEIGRRYGKHPSTVGYWVGKHGLQANGRDRHAARGGITRETLAALVQAGKSSRGIAAELGVSQATVRHWLKRHGLQTVRAGRRQPLPEGHPDIERVCERHGAQLYRWRKDGYRCPKCDSERVSRRRRAVKRILVEEAGGRCALCGYDRHPAALEFHHVEPEGKKFAVSNGGATIALSRARVEAAKCVLLCANCHAEVEYGFVALPLLAHDELPP